MSRASGVALTKDGEVVGYFVYNGTSDAVSLSRLQPTVYAAWDAYGEGWPLISDLPACDHVETIPVVLVSRYGGGFYWDGTICPVCKVIRSGFMPYDTNGITVTNGVPDNAPDEIKEWDWTRSKKSGDSI